MPFPSHQLILGIPIEVPLSYVVSATIMKWFVFLYISVKMEETLLSVMKI
jgi:hypothetical protein